MIVIFAREPYGWPPDVTRRQSYRDLKLLLASHEADAEEG